MRNKLMLYSAVLAIAVLGALASAVGVASASGGGKSRDRGGETLKLSATTLQFQYVDESPPGLSVGDEFVFSESLFKRGRHVGMSGTVCTVTHATPPYTGLTVHCVATLSLRHGQITLQGLVELQSFNDPGPFPLAVTGGTGAYRSAGGEAVTRGAVPGVRSYKVKLDLPKKQHSRGHRRH